MATSNEKQPSNQEERRREIEREEENTRAENYVRMAQCDPNEIARQAEENLVTASQQGCHLPKLAGEHKSARPRPEVPGG